MQPHADGTKEQPHRDNARSATASEASHGPTATTATSERRFVELPAKQIATTVFGLAFLWLCLKVPALALASRLGKLPIEIDAGSGLAWYVFYGAATLAVCAAWSHLIRHGMKKRRLKTLMAVAGVCGCVGFALLSLIWNPVVLLAALVLIAVFVACYLAQWGEQVEQLPLSWLPIVILASYAVSEALRALCLQAGILGPARPFFPLVSMTFYLATPLASSKPHASEAQSIRQLPWGFVLACIVLIALWTFTQDLISSTTLSTQPGEERVWSYVLSCLIMCVMMLYFIFRRRKLQSAEASSRRPGIALLVPFSALIVAYMIILSLASIVPGLSIQPIKLVMISVNQCLEVFLLVLIVQNAAERQLSLTMPLGLYTTVFTSGLWMVVSELLRNTGLPFEDIGPTSIAMISTSITAVVFILLLMRLIMLSSKNAAPVAEEESPVDAFYEIEGKGHGLSARELDVMRLLYRGFSGQRIGEELHISESTARSHTNSVYRKLGLHSKQELIDLIDRYRR
jgi:DNA-binding CsgD family transcriptional regulator